MHTFLCVLMLVPALLCADSSRETGLRLLKKFWRDLKESNASHVRKYMDHNFQAVHSFGAQNKEEELKIIANLHITRYRLTHITITNTDDTLLITYMAHVTSNVNHVSTRITAPRMTTFQKIRNSWKLISHANLVPPSS